MTLNWVKKFYPATELKPLEPDSLSPFVSTTINGSYFLTWRHISNLVTKDESNYSCAIQQTSISTV